MKPLVDEDGQPQITLPLGLTVRCPRHSYTTQKDWEASARNRSIIIFFLVRLSMASVMLGAVAVWVASKADPVKNLVIYVALVPLMLLVVMIFAALIAFAP